MGKSFDKRVMAVLGREWCGNNGPPLDHQTLYVEDDGVHRVFSTSNDGFEVWIGYPDDWQMFMRRRAARFFAWWTFKIWVLDWFGLRTELWYRALNHSISGSWRRIGNPKRVRNLTRISSHDEWEKQLIKGEYNVV